MKLIHKVWLAYLVGIAVMLLTARLGVWQWHRAVEKSEKMVLWTRAMQYPPTPWQGGDLPASYQRLVLSGQWLLPQQILLDNRINNGQAGFHVITPLLLSPGKEAARRIVAVNRGWLAKPAQGVPIIPPPATQTVIVRHEPLPRFFELQQGNDEGIVWQNLDWPRYQEKIGVGLQPVYAVALNDLKDGLKRDWPRANLDETRHQAYAAQWFGLSLLTFGLMCYFTIRRYRQAATRKALHVK